MGFVEGNSEKLLQCMIVTFIGVIVKSKVNGV